MFLDQKKDHICKAFDGETEECFLVTRAYSAGGNDGDVGDSRFLACSSTSSVSSGLMVTRMSLNRMILSGCGERKQPLSVLGIGQHGDGGEQASQGDHTEAVQRRAPARYGLRQPQPQGHHDGHSDRGGGDTPRVIGEGKRKDQEPERTSFPGQRLGQRLTNGEEPISRPSTNNMRSTTTNRLPKSTSPT